MSAPFQVYSPPGRVAAQFLASDAFVQAIMGPVGSGKTGASLMKPLYIARRQAPDPRDGVRRTKFAVIRDTARNLEKTTIPSWHRWVPKDMPGSDWLGGSGGQPAKHTIRWALPDGTQVELIIEFIGLGDGSAETAMPGWEGTGAYLNEADKLARDVLTYVKGRVGRYPAKDVAAGFGGATWRGVWMDFNAPDVDHWLYKVLVEGETDEGFDDPRWTPQFFVQPGAMILQGGRYILNPRAENLANLPDGYYEQQVAGQPTWYCRRMVANQWGANRDGQPVYEEWNDEFHVSPVDLLPVLGLRLRIGVDAGLTGALVIGQEMPNGQLRILDELVAPPTGWGAIKFGEALNRLLAERYAPWARGLIGHNGGPRLGGADDIDVFADPAAGSRSSTDEQSWLQVFAATTGLRVRLAPTNLPTMRLEAVRKPLTRLIDGAPGLFVSPRCKVLRKGFNSGYRLRRVLANGATERYADTPDKNEFSHVHDGCQYFALGETGHLALLGQRPGQNGGRRQTQAITDDNPRGSWEGGDGRQAYAE